ncbi:sensor histidine kinase [Corynebacterium breve]|uniref:Sensor histidine kinase n=1 Tax=Corynebacterium breve TaxID=3049799 RepID=A0ABY8VH25_9CORY|nr:sensor histidine kinase [Corynebacterium breve]WIM67563.1 sensor histidine kinase [Corynebacterium breve]
MSSTLATLQRDVADLPYQRAFDGAIHALTVTLLTVSAFAAVGYTLERAAIHLILTALFAFVYFFGRYNQARWVEAGKILWVFILTAVWIMDLLVSPVSIYWVFSLFFLYLRVMDDWRGLVSIAFGLGVSILVQLPGKITLGGVMGPAVSAGVVIAIHYSYRTISRISAEREVLIQELVSTQDKLAHTERAAGVAQERQRLAHEIHDTVAQGLSSIQMLLNVAERDLKNTGLSDEQLAQPLHRMELARESAADSLAETRAMIAALTPAQLTDHSLVEALERIAESFSESGGVDISVETDGEPQQLPMRVEAGLLRIAQGATGNVVKHAEATRARITLTFSSDEVRLDIVDNGKGFDPEALAEQPTGLGHIGLDAMRTRAEELGGELVVESTPGGPTALSVALPVTTIVEEPGNIIRKTEED